MTKEETEVQAIQNLQRYLRQLSYDEESIPAPPIDGIFESDTRRALQSFQVLKDLEPTGRADQETWELLYAAYRASLARNSPPRTVAVLPRTPPDAELIRGSIGFPVMALQHMLRELTFNASYLGPIEVTGTYDEATEAAVLAFQAHNVLKKTGRVDLETWNEITDQYNVLFTSYSVE